MFDLPLNGIANGLHAALGVTKPNPNPAAWTPNSHLGHNFRVPNPDRVPTLRAVHIEVIMEELRSEGFSHYRIISPGCGACCRFRECIWKVIVQRLVL